MALLTVSEIREHVETDLGDTALARVVDAADEEIIDRLGVLASATEVLDATGVLLHLARKATAITSVVERIYEDDYTLATNDYQLLSDGFRVQRLQGTNYPSLTWRGRVTISYTPKDETISRKQLLVDLVKLQLQYSGNKSEAIGSASIQRADYAKEKDSLFNTLRMRNRRMPLA